MRLVSSGFGWRAAALVAALLIAPQAAAQDATVEAARAAGQVGEQADGLLGYPTGASPSADVRARVDQINIRRRAAYSERAVASGATPAEMAAAVACQIFSSRIAVGEKYRNEAGQWRQRTASAPVEMPSFCPS
jgi:uncharacterized protein